MGRGASGQLRITDDAANNATGTVYVVDDDPGIRRALGRLLRACGHAVETYASAEEFLAAPAGEGPACLVLDLQMPGLNGLELQERMNAAGLPLPVVFITGHGDIPSSVRAMKAGAVDFLPKPFDDRALLRAVEISLTKDRAAQAERALRIELESRYGRLTPREREVFDGVVKGRLNKQIAGDLGASEKTIKVHRGRVMRKMEAESLADLVRMAQRLGR